MKRRLASLLAIFTGIVWAAGGSAVYAQKKVGYHGGLSIPNFRGSEGDPFSRGFTSRQGLFFGIIGELGLTPEFSLVAEVNFSSQGGKRNGLQMILMDLPPELPVPPGTMLYADFKNETILDYIEIPFMGRLSFGSSPRFFLNAGPYIGTLIGAKAVTEGTSTVYLDEGGTVPVLIPPDGDPLVIPLDADTNVKDSLKKTNVGIAGGGGFMYRVGPGHIVVEARFQLGLTVIQKDVETSGSTKTGAVILSVGYTFSLRD